MLINMCVDVAAYHGFCLRSVCASVLSCLMVCDYQLHTIKHDNTDANAPSANKQKP
jgi:hypothetical protein